MRSTWLPALLPMCFAIAVGLPAGTTTAAEGDLAQAYAGQIHPLMVKTCGGCHGAEPKDNDLNLAGFATSEALIAQPAVLEHVIERLHIGDMPPREAPQPSDAEREQLLGWFSAALDAEAAARAGDPGPVTLRRLSNVEYDNAVRDLTGIDMRPTQAREFPPDAVGGEGFANVGEAMPVTPVLVERYLKTARDVAARAVLLPTGFRFSASPDRPEWTAEAEKALRAFHSRYSGPGGAPPLERHLAAMLRHRERLASSTTMAGPSSRRTGATPTRTRRSSPGARPGSGGCSSATTVCTACPPTGRNSGAVRSARPSTSWSDGSAATRPCRRP